MNAKTLAHDPDVWEGKANIHEPLTEEEREYALKAMAKARQFREAWLAARGGVPFEPGWKELAELRDERTRQLGG